MRGHGVSTVGTRFLCDGKPLPSLGTVLLSQRTSLLLLAARFRSFGREGEKLANGLPSFGPRLLSFRSSLASQRSGVPSFRSRLPFQAGEFPSLGSAQPSLARS